MQKKEQRRAEIWFDEDDVIHWHGHHVKPSEVITMGAVLQEAGLAMMGDMELYDDEPEPKPKQKKSKKKGV